MAEGSKVGAAPEAPATHDAGSPPGIVREAGTDAEPPADPTWVVLVVDDDAAVCNSLKFALELDGFDVRTYVDPRDLISADLPGSGCLVVDYNLPGLNGLDLLRELDRRNIRLPSFLITSNPSANVQRRARAQGVTIIEKPLLGNQLSDAVRNSFARARRP